MEDKIKCPYCDYEYLPGEIYLPNHFLGQPKDIERDYSGAIIWNDGIEANLDEKFTCVKCFKEFKVSASITYTTTKTPEFNTTYETAKYATNRLFLKED